MTFDVSADAYGRFMGRFSEPLAVGFVDAVGIAPARTVVTVTNAERLANSTAAVREQGAVLPSIWGVSHVAPSLHSVVATYGTGWDSIGGRNEALHRQYSPPQAGPAVSPRWGPIMVNGEACMQCR